ncbi:MAG: YdcF family protein [Rubrobacteraceae bacterium]
MLEDLWRLWGVYRGQHLLSQLKKEALPKTAVIMGAQVLRGGRPSPALEARVEHAARLYHQGELEFLIPSGGMGEYPPREAVLMMNILRREGVPNESVLLEDKAVSTWDSALRMAEIIRERGIGSVRVVTDPLHCVRSVWAFREFGLEAWAEPAYESPMWRKLESRRGQLVREAVALIWYRVRYRAGSRSRR